MKEYILGKIKRIESKGVVVMRHPWLRIIGGFCIGIGVGICVGVATGNVLSAVLIGFGLGLCMAVALNSKRG